MLVELQGIRKRFPGVQALDGVDFALQAGEVHALLGENGAGKSTLVGVLGGLVRPDQGSMRVDGQPVQLGAPRDALRLGIGTVHQHLLCSERHTALENLVLGWPGLPLVPRRRSLRRAVAEAIEGYGLELDAALDTPMHGLPVGTRQKVEIARALLHGARALVLDEPTAVLSPAESAGLFALVRAFCAQGGGVVFISHKLDEVLDIADRVTVLRRGRRVACHRAGEIDAAGLARDMIGAPGADQGAASAPVDRLSGNPEAPEVLRLEDVHAGGDGPGGAGSLHGVDLVLREGEVLGIAGVAGSGQRALAELMAGLRAPASGRLVLFGTQRAGRACHPGGFAREGVAHVPEDRQRSGVAGALSVMENLVLRRYRRDFTRWGRLDRRRARAWAEACIAAHDIRCAGPDARTASLSGGNIQKLIVARELDGAPRLIVAAYPFRGLDVGAAQGVRARLRAARDRGAAVVLISEELEPLFETADMIGALFRGRLFGPAPRGSLTPEVVGQWMGGHAAPGSDQAGAP